MKPLILHYSTARQADDLEPKFEYNFKKSLNTITINNQKIIVIDADANSTNSIKTKVNSETSNDLSYFVESKRITEVKRERDDLPLLELQTKTLTKREDDDQHFSHNQ